MPTLRIRFPGGRYHATPWGHHVNEGLIEWPPSPWRLLRTLIACGFSSQRWTEIPPAARSLLDKLAAVLPCYQLPEASAAHSRHYMPVGSIDKAQGREATTLVFDTFANVGDGELLIHWPCELTAEETDLLGRLAEALGYLGRSESWVEAKLIADSEPGTARFNAFPHQEGSHPGREYEQVSLMAAVTPGDYRTWQQETTEPILSRIVLPESKKKPTSKQLEKLATQQAQAVIAYPCDLLACLTTETARWKQHGWSQPPGSQRVLYWRRSDVLQVGVPKQTIARDVAPVTTMLLSLTTPSGNRSALPSCSRTLPQAELFHRSVVGRVADGQRVHCPELTGKDADGRPLHDRHHHAHTIPLVLNHEGDGRLDHILVYARMGLRGLAQHAIRTLRRTFMKGGVGELQVAVVGIGNLGLLRQLPTKPEDAIEQLLGSPGGSRVWESATPFVFPRHLKTNGKNSFAEQVNAELASRELPFADRIEVCGDLTRELRHFVRRRKPGRAQPPADMGYGLRLTFSEPIRGPLLLGYASHYGLGRFRAVFSANQEL